MNPTAPVTYFADADRIGWITFDDPTGRVNIFNSAMAAAFELALDAVVSDRPRAVVITSAKDRIFIAGRSQATRGAARCGRRDRV